MRKMFKEGVSGYVFFALALSSITALAVITIFIIMNGAALIADVGLFHFIFGMEWLPDQGKFGIFPMIVGTLAVTLGAALIEMERWRSMPMRKPRTSARSARSSMGGSANQFAVSSMA